MNNIQQITMNAVAILWAGQRWARVQGLETVDRDFGRRVWTIYRWSARRWSSETLDRMTEKLQKEEVGS